MICYVWSNAWSTFIRSVEQYLLSSRTFIPKFTTSYVCSIALYFFLNLNWWLTNQFSLGIDLNISNRFSMYNNRLQSLSFKWYLGDLGFKSIIVLSISRSSHHSQLSDCWNRNIRSKNIFQMANKSVVFFVSFLAQSPHKVHKGSLRIGF